MPTNKQASTMSSCLSRGNAFSRVSGPSSPVAGSLLLVAMDEHSEAQTYRDRRLPRKTDNIPDPPREPGPGSRNLSVSVRRLQEAEASANLLRATCTLPASPARSRTSASVERCDSQIETPWM